MIIRAYRPDDEPDLRRCFVELQDHEHAFDPTVAPGEAIADEYVAFMLERCGAPGGHLLMAEDHHRVVGFVSVLVRPRQEPDDPDLLHAEVGELSVLSAHRARGLGTQLLHAAETLGRDAGATSLRVRVRSGNPRAQALYRRLGFEDDYLTLSKPLTPNTRRDQNRK